MRDRAKTICEILTDSTKLQEEREFSKKTRDKFSGISTTYSTSFSNETNLSAAPASGKYGGFGSEDINKFGYQSSKYNTSYDPYTSKDTA